jgi:hypothetical protein
MGEYKIALSVIVRIVGGGEFLHRCLSRLVPQIEGQPIEVIVPYDSTVVGIRPLEELFPQFSFVDMGVVQANGGQNSFVFAHQLYDRRTAAGLRIARGDLLALLEDYGVPDPDWCDQLLQAHRLPYGVIGGAVEHGGRGVLNWAVYLLDFGRYRLPLHEGPTKYLTDVNVSYKRPDLEAVKAVWADRYNEVTVHGVLASRGVVMWRRPQIVVREDRGALFFPHLLAERYAWGRVFGYMRLQEFSLPSRLFYIAVSPLLPALMLWRVARRVLSGQRNRKSFLLALPPMIALALAWCLGELVAYVTGVEVSVRGSQLKTPETEDQQTGLDAHRG